MDPIGMLDAVNIELFDDAQFLREPRLRLLQQAFHSLRRSKQHWAEIGVMGAAGEKTVNPHWRMAEALANANLQRATLPPASASPSGISCAPSSPTSDAA